MTPYDKMRHTAHHVRYSNGNRPTYRPVLIALGVVLLLSALAASGDALDDDVGAIAVSPAAAADALHAARAAIEAAMAADNLWLGTERVLSRAAAYHDAGDYARAAALARAAQHQARMALNQAKLERARYLLRTIEVDREVDALTAVRGLLQAHDGDAALRLMRELTRD